MPHSCFVRLSLICAAIIGIAAVAFPERANAGAITSGSVYNNTAGELPGAFGVDLISDQSGLSSGYTDGVTDFATFTGSGVTHATVESAGGTWLSAGIPSFPFFLDFDLGAGQGVLSLALWNGTAGNTADISGFSVFTSSVADFSVSTLAGNFINPIGVGGPEPVTVFDLIDSVGQYVRLQVNSYYGNSCCTGIGEVAWDVGSVTAVPEPATLGLFGLGLAGLVLLRRRAKG